MLLVLTHPTVHLLSMNAGSKTEHCRAPLGTGCSITSDCECVPVSGSRGRLQRVLTSATWHVVDAGSDSIGGDTGR